MVGLEADTKMVAAKMQRHNGSSTMSGRARCYEDDDDEEEDPKMTTSQIQWYNGSSKELVKGKSI